MTQRPRQHQRFRRAPAEANVKPLRYEPPLLRLSDRAQMMPILHFEVRLIDLTALWDVCGVLPALCRFSQQMENPATTKDYASSWMDKILDQYN